MAAPNLLGGLGALGGLGGGALPTLGGLGGGLPSLGAVSQPLGGGGGLGSLGGGAAGAASLGGGLGGLSGFPGLGGSAASTSLGMPGLGALSTAAPALGAPTSTGLGLGGLGGGLPSLGGALATSAPLQLGGLPPLGGLGTLAASTGGLGLSLPSAPLSTAPAPAPPLSLGGLAGLSMPSLAPPAPAASTALPAAPLGMPPTGLSLGSLLAPPATTVAASGPAPVPAPLATTTTVALGGLALPGMSLGMPTAPLAAAPAAATTVAPTGPPPKDITHMTVKDILAHWDEQMKKQASAFKKEAEQVVKWDGVLRRSAATLDRLTVDAHELAKTSMSLGEQLDNIDAHQRSMDATLQALESEMDALLPAVAATTAGAAMMGATTGDAQRAKTYATAQEVDNLLVRLAEALKELVTRANREFERQQNDPMEQIRQILDHQMAALQYVDREATQLKERARTIGGRLEMSYTK